MDYSLRCTKCSHAEADDAFRCSRCGSILEVRIDYSSIMIGKAFRSRRVKNSKYLLLFPIKRFEMEGGEGGTRLVSHNIGAQKVMFKMETENPTGSFKDRGSAVEISKAVELGRNSVCCASTGNMGMSVARYAKLAGISATIFISKDASKEKIARIKSYGARLVKVDGDFNTALRNAEAFARKDRTFMCGDYHFRKEGQKSVAYEIIDQCGSPDFIFLPVGNATLLSAVYKGLSEYVRFGLLDSMPRIVAVQSEKCDPLVRAYMSGRHLEYVKPKTVADAIAVGYPTFGLEGIAALKKTHGIAVNVSEDQLRDAILMLEEKGIGAEAGGAAGFAGFMKFYENDREMFRGKKTVIVITGNN